MAASELTPFSLRECVGIYRAYRRSLAEHERLRREHRTELPAKYLAGAELLPSRRELLERMPKGGVVAEAGVALGDLSALILEICRPRKLYLIDLWQAKEREYGPAAVRQVETKFAREIAEGIVEIRQGLSWEMIAGLPDQSLDWAYLDAAHDLESVERDLKAVESKVKTAGYIAGHDYIGWSHHGLQRFGVVEAVNAHCVNRHWRFRYLTHESSRHCSYALCRLDSAT